MKKLVLAAGFTLVGIIAVSAQTEVQDSIHSSTAQPEQSNTQNMNGWNSSSTDLAAAASRNQKGSDNAEISSDSSKVGDMNGVNANKDIHTEGIKPTDMKNEEGSDSKNKKP
ncbi:hypothetical protein [Chryseobacterium potabilaquae]|uniref:Uncharacterized protein n=1 Tax=Chryseobacterium potabilaquae TaxID=2675057 RepID=A0A6N4X3L6_9FLAO|nr:hypothetical protein [Chryseobacterium potabilaquae]CAA7195051.1 hypothetical protein CHRY9293_01295 [Chryseobacterium potabilaquae]